MKKYIILFILLFMPITVVFAEEKETVTLENCNSLNQIWLNRNNEVIRVGLLAYDTGDTSLNKEIQEYACNKLKSATKIEIEKDINNKTEDKYNRELVWLYVDDVLLQEDLILNGYGMVNHVTDDFSNIDNLCSKEANAIKNKKGIWTLGVEEKYCDSGIILEKEEKESQGIKNTKKISQEDMTKVFVIFVVALILAATILIRGKHEEKR